MIISRAKKSKHGDKERDGPYTIQEVGNNGTLRIDKGTYSDIVNIRNCDPYFSWNKYLELSDWKTLRYRY